MSDTTLLSIGEVAGRAGLRTSALRFYEDQGLIAPAGRIGGQRRFDPSTVERLTVIGFCRGLGFSLAEIRDLLEPPGRAGQRQRWRRLVDAKLAELADTAARVEAMSDILRASRDCDCIDLNECARRCAPQLAG